MKRHEILTSLGALAVSVVMLSSLWSYLSGSTLLHKPGIGKAPYNQAH